MATTHTFNLDIAVVVNTPSDSDRAKALSIAQAVAAQYAVKAFLPKLGKAYVRSALASETEQFVLNGGTVTIDVTATQT